jgi:L-alanine-DL-glutamate epimerase-like enolase superfamily enzyme
MELTVRIERWPLAGTFTISRGSKTEAVVVVAELNEGNCRGRGECVPYARYGETPDGVVAALESLRPRVQRGLDCAALQDTLAAGAARNALDCAYWDVSAKQSGRRVHELAGLPPPARLTTAYTISLASVAEMAAAEGWDSDNCGQNLAACADAGVALVEQPLPEGRDDALRRLKRPVPVCADESVRDRGSLDSLVGKYDAVNIKLDKAGGLTEALALAAEAERRGLAVMVGCMVATSLAMAPATIVAQKARVVDLDGPLLLARDRAEGLRYEGSVVYPPDPTLWG